MTRPHGDDETAPPGGAGDAASAARQPATEAGERSLVEDIEALIDDGRTYLEAEIAYQKTRAVFVVDRAKAAIVLAAVSAAFAFLALVGLTVGLIIALAPLLTPWGASAVVVGLLAIGALIAARAAKQRWQGLMDAIDTVRTDER